MLGINSIYNIDNKIGMAQFPNGHFELAIVDPPYGIKAAKTVGLRKKWSGSYNNKKHEEKDWDNEPPPEEYWDELFRVSKNQIVFGANYFKLPPSLGIAAWDKQCDKTSFSNFELIWTSFKKSSKLFRYPIQGTSQNRFHPTQKPVELYHWLLSTYASKGDKILDTHMGSGSSIIACIDMGFPYIAFELDEGYFNAASKRIEIYKGTKGMKLFA